MNADIEDVWACKDSGGSPSVQGNFAFYHSAFSAAEGLPAGDVCESGKLSVPSFTAAPSGTLVGIQVRKTNPLSRLQEAGCVLARGNERRAPSRGCPGVPRGAAHCHRCHVANLRNLVWNLRRKRRSFNLRDSSLFSHFLSVVRKCVGVGIHSEAGFMCCVCHSGWPKVFEGP